MERNSSKIGFKTKSVNNYDKKVIPDDILDKYNKINTEDKIDNYCFINNTHITSLTGNENTRIKNNNTKIKKYIDKKSINEIILL